MAQDLLALPMPSLILQPLVENAVYHGVAQLTAGGAIRVSVREEAGTVQALVQNPIPETAARSGGHQMALENIRQRLTVLFAAQGQLQTLQADGVFSVELSYPLRDMV